MLQKNIVKQPKSIVEVQITLAWEDVEPTWNKVLEQMGQEVEVPGFRKGQAPANMVEQALGTRLHQEVMQQLMPQMLMQALQGTDIVPIDYPKYQLVSFAKGGETKFNATVTTRPEIKVGDYKAIKVERPALKEVKDEDVAKIIDELFRRWSLKNPQPAAADGTQPTPNDDFAKGVGAESLEDLKTKIKTDLEGEAKYNNELDYEEAILQQVEKVTTVDIPDILIQDELNRMLVSLQRQITDRGLLMEEYLKSQGKTADSIKNEWKPQAEKNVRMELGLSEIARSEGVQISDEELQAEIDKIQDQRIKAQFNSEEPRMHLRHALRQTKTLNLLKTLVG